MWILPSCNSEFVEFRENAQNLDAFAEAHQLWALPNTPACKR